MAKLSSTQIHGSLLVDNDITALGNIRANKVYNAVYNDYAEWFERAQEDLEPGDVLSWTENGVVKSFDLNDINVIGVYSDTYGHILGGDNLENMEDNICHFVPIGIAGRVGVKIKGQVEIGDLVVASEIEGVAKKAETYIPGTVIGKCLERKQTEEIERITILIMNC